MTSTQKEFGIRIKTVRKAREETQDSFGALIGVTKSTVSAYENGDVFPPFNVLKKIVELGGKSFDWLFMGGPATPYYRTEGDNQETSLPEAPTGYISVPRYEIAASAGGGALVESEQIVDYLMFSTSWVQTALGANPNQIALISVMGDSMSPTYNDGDLILVDTSADRPRSDAVYVIQHDSYLWVKRLHFHFDGSISVISDNPRYPEQSITGEALERLRIVGRVIWRGGR